MKVEIRKKHVGEVKKGNNFCRMNDYMKDLFRV
jgi:hypothetical protein